MSDIKPPDKESLKLSMKHLKDRVKFNKAHAADHMKDAKKAQKMLSGRMKTHSRGY